jgi:hypothetical protein
MDGLQIRNELDNASKTRLLHAVVRRLPGMTGAPIRLQSVRGLRDLRGPVHGGSFLRERRIAISCTRVEFPRILVHELFHFVWLRLGNPVRRSWEEHLRQELRCRARGELGWSAEWRKNALRPGDIGGRTTVWRLYCCESFCDTAAWLYSSAAGHPEFTLAANFRRTRRRWFHETIGNRQLSI